MLQPLAGVIRLNIFLVYACYLVFQLFSHKSLYDDKNAEEVKKSIKYAPRNKKVKGDPESGTTTAANDDVGKKNLISRFMNGNSQQQETLTMSPNPTSTDLHGSTHGSYPENGRLIQQEVQSEDHSEPEEEEEEQPTMSVIMTICLLIVVTVVSSFDGSPLFYLLNCHSL